MVITISDEETDLSESYEISFTVETNNTDSTIEVPAPEDNQTDDSKDYTAEIIRISKRGEIEIEFSTEL